MPVIDTIKKALHLDKNASDSSASTSTPTGSTAPGAPSSTTTAPVAANPAVTSVATTHEAPAYNSKDVTVLFVLGGPGVGKGTQCANLVNDYHFVHLSAGDLLRAEQNRPDSEVGAMIKDYIKEGKIVPMEVTVKLLETAIGDALKAPPPQWAAGTSPRFLIDGFPRKMDQAIKFDDSVCASKAVLFFSCTEEVMTERLMERGKTSGREDDNKESIIKRFRTFVETSMPVVEYYRGKNKVYEIPAVGTKEAVYEQVRIAVDEILLK